MWIRFPKANPNEEEGIERCWCVDATLYFTKFSWDYYRVGKLFWLILLPFSAWYFKIIICVQEHIRAIKNVLEHREVRGFDHLSTLFALDFLIEIISPKVC